MCFVTVFLMHILFKVLVNLDIASQADDEAQTGGIKTQTKKLRTYYTDQRPSGVQKLHFTLWCFRSTKS